MASASLTNTMMISTPSRWFSVRSCNNKAFSHQNGTSVDMQKLRLLLSCNNTQWRGLQHVSKPISAMGSGSGLEVSVTDLEEELISMKDAKVVVESPDENKIKVRVDLTGDNTQKVFDKVITNLARSAPPIPGFREEKGGKTSKVSVY
ncbi:hypothetical protein Dsin_018346 [Dipteronia sinensis]|uniref:Trigger factor ribosome-binding bacterial domain-containing protein n=1 Tax=Dipteronia sinensis TaxID=43782 RepID=A0AAE0A555_9ROSI|nr:hypothetical protein Dsin_018346 [Dipteronia sinensis]